MEHTLTPYVEDDQIIDWIAKTQLVLRKHLYITAFARWKDEEGCSGTQDATWTFHIKTRDA